MLYVIQYKLFIINDLLFIISYYATWVCTHNLLSLHRPPHNNSNFLTFFISQIEISNFLNKP